MSKEIPTEKVTVKVCVLCGGIVDRPHTEDSCPMSTGITRVWKGTTKTWKGTAG
jgi:hypothetical protein